MQQFVGDRNITRVGFPAFHVVHWAGKSFNADMRLHAEAPLVALPGLVHFRVTRIVGTPGRAGRINYRGFHNCTHTKALAFAGRVLLTTSSVFAPASTSRAADKDSGLILDRIKPA